MSFVYVNQNKKFKINQKNLKFLGILNIQKSNILSNSDICWCHIQKNVEINAKNINTANYCSPLKMFDYLAAGKVIIHQN